MFESVFEVLALLATVACGLSGGVFFAFSTFVTGGLRALPPDRAAAAMTAMNRAAPRPPFLLLLVGALVLAAATSVVGLAGGEAGTGWALAGTGAYLVGALVVTGAVNVPMNDALDRSSDGGARWPAYTMRWTAWNHVRTVVVATSAVLLGLAVAA